MTYPASLRDHAVKLYAVHRSARKVAHHVGVDDVTVLKWARAAGIPIPGPGRPRAREDA